MFLSNRLSCARIALVVSIVLIVLVTVVVAVKEKEMIEIFQKLFNIQTTNAEPPLKFATYYSSLHDKDFLRRDYRSANYDIVVVLFILSGISALVLNICLGIGISRADSHSSERPFHIIIGQLVLSNLIGVVFNLCEKIPITIFMNDIFKVLEFRLEWYNQAIRYGQTFEECYNSMLMLVLASYMYISLIHTQTALTFRKYIWATLVLTFVVSIALALFYTIAGCNYDSYSEGDIIYEKNIQCTNIFNRFIEKKITCIIISAVVLITVAPFLLLLRVVIASYHANSHFEHRNLELFRMICHIIIAYKIPFILFTTQRYIQLDSTFSFCFTKLIDTTKFLSYCSTVYFVFSKCEDVKYGLLGKRRTHESTLNGIVMYNNEVYIGPVIVA